MKVLVADKIPAAGTTALVERGHDVVFEPELSAPELPAALARTGAQVLVVRSTKVTSECVRSAPSLALIVRAGAGVNTIDLAAASAAGVFVTNCPGKNAIAVAELTMGLLLALDRRIPDAVAQCREGRWNKTEFGKAEGVFGRSLGLLGFGAIAREVARRATAFGMRVWAFHPWITEAEVEPFGVRMAASLDELLTRSAVLSVHVPYDDATRHIIGARELERLPRGAIVLHTSRGGVIDDAALLSAIERGHLRAGLDVLEGEPSEGVASLELPLPRAAGCYVTPHIGASTEQAEVAIAHEVARIVDDFARRGIVHNAVNLAAPTPGRWNLTIRHHDRIGVLAGVLDVLRREEVSVKEMTNAIFAGALAASASIVIDRRPSDALLAQLRAREDIIAIELADPS